jgi:hypothetical protein
MLREFSSDAILRCGHLVCHDFGKCEMWATTEALELFQQMPCRTCCAARPCYFCGVLNASASVIALDEGRCSHDQIIQGGCD